MRGRSLRLTVTAALVALTGAGAAGSAVGASAPAACSGHIALAGGYWELSDSGLSNATVVRMPVYAPDRVYVTDGTTLRRTDDAGCNWHTVVLPAVEVAGVGALHQVVHLNDVATPSSATSTAYTYAAGDATITSALPDVVPRQPIVFTSSDSGTTWTASSNGLPRLGTVTEVAASDLQPRNVYALVTGAGSSNGIYVSNDAGSTWVQRSSDTAVTQLRVSPAVVNQVYGLRSGSGLVLSTDGGATFAPVAGAGGTDVRNFAANPGSGFVQIVAGHTGSTRFDLSLDGGRTWRHLAAPGKPASVAISAVLPVLATYDDTRLDIERVDRGGVTSLDLTPGVGPPVAGTLQASAPTGVGFGLVGLARDHRHVLRSVFDALTYTPVRATLTPIHLLPQVTVKQFPSTLSSPVRVVHLAAGASRDVPYRLLLPRTPSPVDLMFLVDTTDSTQETIDAVREGLQSVVNDLRSAGLDVEFGVGDFKDYPGWSGSEGPDSDYPYRLDRRIGPVDASLQRALASLRAADGGDMPESDLTALYQSTVGTGQKAADVYSDTPRRRWVVRPGQQAGYRAQSLRLALLATDEPFHYAGDGSLSPSWAATIDALNRNGVHQVGLAVESTGGDRKPEPGVFDSWHDERRMARATGSLAPAGGVDCDGNGSTDISSGQPLVCRISIPADNRTKVNALNHQVALGRAPQGLHLAPLVVQLAASIPDDRSVGLAISGAPPSVGRVVSTPAAPVVNVRADNTLGYVVRYTCPRAHVAHTWPLTLTATAAGRPLTSTSTTVTCDPAPKVPPAVAAVPPAAAAVIAGVAPGAPPNPPTNVNTNINPNPAVNPNAGFAQQDEEQPQLALADADQGLQSDTSMAMSRRTTDAQAAWMLGAAGVMTAAAAGYAVRTRWRPARQESLTRRRIVE